MACTFSGIFYVHNIRDKYIDCVFIDEYHESHELSILYYDNRSARDGPFPEASPCIMSGHVYILHGTMTVVDKDYSHPSVPFHPHFPSLHNTYIQIDASHELLSNVTVHSGGYPSLSSDLSHGFNVSNAPHDLSHSKNCRVDLRIQE